MNLLLRPLLSKASTLSTLLQPQILPTVVSCRQKSRHATRMRRAAIKARMKAIRASMPPKPPKVPFMQKLHQALTKSRPAPAEPTSGFVSRNQSCLMWPSRLLQVDKPLESEDDVFRIAATNYLLSFSDAVNMLRRIYDPVMYDCPNSPVHMRLDLNMNADLEGVDFVPDAKEMMVLPHVFEHGKRRVVMAFCKDPNVQMSAREAGAEFAGDEAVIRKIRRGEFKTEEVDYVVAHVELVKELGTIRGILKEKMPSQYNGTLGLDVIPLVRHFRNAITAHVKPDEVNPAWGSCTVIVGKLDMTNEQLEANAAFLIKRICALRPRALSLGHFIHRAALIAPDAKAFFPWKFLQYVPPIPDNDAELIKMAEQVGSKKKKKKVAATKISK